jgi:hypothetical protein
MKRIALVAALVAALTACAPDRGKCLASHTVTVPAYSYTTFIQVDKVMVPIVNFVPESVRSVCDQWERPNG